MLLPWEYFTAKSILKSLDEERKKYTGPGALSFHPDKNYVKICEKLVKKGLLKIDPIEGGYMLPEDYDQIYASVDKESIIE